MNVVDSVSKMSHFIPTHHNHSPQSGSPVPCTCLETAWTSETSGFRPGPQFIVEFTRELYWLLGVKLAATTAYHPQGDGQTERVNQELEQYLRLFVNERQDNWDELLPLAEFQYNNHVHSATQQTPFMLDTGRHPRMGFKPHQPESQLETVNKF